MGRTQRRKELELERIREAISILVSVAGFIAFIGGIVLLIWVLCSPDEGIAEEMPPRDIYIYRRARTDEGLMNIESEQMLEEVPEVEAEPDTVIEIEETAFIYNERIPLSAELQKVTYEAAVNFGVEHSILLAVMYRESGFNQYDNNGKCYGLMQINRCNFAWLEECLSSYGVSDIKGDPVDNILAGAYLLGLLLDKYDDVHKALMSYNCGEAGAKRLWEKGYYSSSYSRSVVDLAEDFSR